MSGNPERERWAAAAEHYVRTLCYPSERVTHDIGEYLRDSEMGCIARGLRGLRTHVSRAIKALECGDADMDTLGDVAARMTNEARILNHYFARLQEAAEKATDEAVAAEIARRKTDEAWQQEQERLASIDKMFGGAA